MDRHQFYILQSQFIIPNGNDKNFLLTLLKDVRIFLVSWL